MFHQPVKFKFSVALMLTALSLLNAPFAKALEPAAMNWGGVEVTPKIRIAQQHNSNIYRQKNDTIASGITTVSPEVTFALKDRLNNYSLTLFSDYDKYNTKTIGKDDSFDYGLLSSAHLEFNDRNALDFYGDIKWMHDDRGDEFNAPDPFSIDEPDKYIDERLGSIYRFGLADYTHLKTEIFTYKRYYQNNNRTAESDPRIRDYRQNEIQLTFSSPVKEQLSWFVELDAANFAYYQSNPFKQITTLDSEEIRGFLGLKWLPKEQLSTYMKAGRAQKRFDDTRFRTLGINIWDASLTYKPTDIDYLYFFGRSRFQETETSGSAIKARTYGFRWQHFWLERLDTSFSYDNTVFDHNQAASDKLSNRRDINDTIALSSTYRFRRWFDVSLLFQHKLRRSNREDLRYKQNIISLAIDLSL